MSDVDRRNVLVAGTALLALAATGCDGQSEETSSENKGGGGNAQGVQVDYTSQGRVAGLSIPEQVTVIGTGGFGAWPALISALSGVREILLIDASDVDSVDLARAPFRAEDVGRGKADALADVIRSFRPGCRVTSRKLLVTPQHTDVFSGPVLFDGTNSSELGQHLHQECGRRGIRYIQGFYNGLAVGASDRHIPSVRFERGEPVPVWAGSAALAGLLASFGAFVGPINFFGDIASLNQAETAAFSAAPLSVLADK